MVCPAGLRNIENDRFNDPFTHQSLPSLSLEFCIVPYFLAVCSFKSTTMTRLLIAVLLLFLASLTKADQEHAPDLPFTCDAVNDKCGFKYDGECDSGLFGCADGSDW